jgi:hypothetical protein
MDLGVCLGVRLGLRSIVRLAHRRQLAIRWITHPPSMDLLLRLVRTRTWWRGEYGS